MTKADGITAIKDVQLSSTTSDATKASTRVTVGTLTNPAGDVLVHVDGGNTAGNVTITVTGGGATGTIILTVTAVTITTSVGQVTVSQNGNPHTLPVTVTVMDGANAVSGFVITPVGAGIAGRFSVSTGIVTGVGGTGVLTITGLLAQAATETDDFGILGWAGSVTVVINP